MKIIKHKKEDVVSYLNLIESDEYPKMEAYKIIAQKTNLNVLNIAQAYCRKNSWLHKYEERIFVDNDIIKVCMMHIKNNPDNLSHAFRLASKETGIDLRSIRNAWYCDNGFLNKYKKNKFIFGIVGFFNIFKKNMKNNILKGKLSL